ncbi:MAG: LuxR C-terminal-related transcriptional regulator [Anaerolineales bacterium]|nr:LuxR C-terminal-related transcriptional regulator [Anaerolineales bacterium]
MESSREHAFPRPLIATKFYPPPAPARSVKRPDLVARIEEGLRFRHPLILISAPAGYGKSALVAEWRESVQRTVTWLSLDDSDNEPLRFFLYLIAALQKADPTIGTELRALLEANQLPPRETLVALLTEDLLASKISLVCVLDDFQSIQDPFIFDILQELIAQPLPLQFIIVTREDPAMPLGRLRAHAQLTEIRAADLRFTKKEIESFFRELIQIPLSEAELSLLEQRTEGWVAGLQLVALSMKGRKDPSAVIASLSGDNRHILSYLTEEVLKQQAPTVQEFLLQTSILTKFNADLCNAVAQRSDSAWLLEQLLTSNLFLTPLDDEGHWYRYHHLFADMLLGLLRRSQPQQLQGLHLRAAKWFEHQDMPLEAIDHALAAADFARSAKLLEKHTWTLLNQGYARQVEAWLQSLPAEWRARSLRANLSFAWMYLLRGNFAEVMPYLEQVESALETAAAEGDLQAECLALKANLKQAQGRIMEAIEHAENALNVVSPENIRVLGLAYLGLGAGYRQAGQFDRAVEALQQAVHFSRDSGDSVTGALAISHLVLMSLQYGRLTFAEQVSTQMIEQMEKSKEAVSPIIGAVYGALGLVYYERNQVEQAREAYLRGIQLSTFLGHRASLVYTKLNLARLLLTEGDLDGAVKNLQDAQELIQAGAPGWLRPSLIAHQVEYFLAVGNLPEAEAILQQSGITDGDKVIHAPDEIQLAYLHILLRHREEEHLREGIKLAERIVTVAEGSQRNYTTMLASVLGALIHEKLGDAKSASEWLERALAIAEPEGYLRSLVDKGAEVAQILRRLKKKTDYVHKLLAAFPVMERTSIRSHPPEGLVEPLSERELEVLRLLAKGTTYAEIAEQLVVSLNTVRFHIKSIYRKLGADKQVKAIERAREVGLLE